MSNTLGKQLGFGSVPRVTRREMLMGAAAFGLAGCLTRRGDPFSDGSILASGNGIRVRFLGTGAAGWRKDWLKKSPYARRQSSVLIENKVLIDFTPCSFDLLPEGCRPEVLFQTHSHGDHYNPTAAVQSGVKRMYVNETWAATAQIEVEAAARTLGLPAPEVIALPFGQEVTVCGLRITGVPANHSTSRVTNGVLERTSLYLIEKGPSRLLYATDTGGIPGDAARMIGIDAHIHPESFKESRYANNPFVREPKPITAFIMEATNGILDDDFRIFVHSSVQTVARIVEAMKKTGRYCPPLGEHALLTHLGLRYRNWSAEAINKELPDSLWAASDGMDVVIG